MYKDLDCINAERSSILAALEERQREKGTSISQNETLVIIRGQLSPIGRPREFKDQ